MAAIFGRLFDQIKTWIKIHFLPLSQITRNHHPRGIFREQFELVIQVILKYLGAALGDHLSQGSNLVR